MATTTPNYGWSVPESTDLVKDGATAIELLGDSIDASFVDLLGGTTGQVLTKASGTDLDFSFTTPDASPVTTKGDLYTFDTADARLAVGANGTTLVADSVEATGLKWVAPAGGGKVLQVVAATTTSATSTTANTPQATSVTVSITPTLVTSKILIMVSNQLIQTSNSSNGCIQKVFRGSTAGTQVEMVSEVLQTIGAGALVVGQSFIGMDSPASTSSTTYVQSIQSAVSGQSVAVAGRQNIIVLEIGA